LELRVACGEGFKKSADADYFHRFLKLPCHGVPMHVGRRHKAVLRREVYFLNFCNIDVVKT
jgi:hypothetical protein